MGQCLIINILEIQLQTVFDQGFSKWNITSVQAPILEKKILLVDKCDNHVLYRITSQIWQLLQHDIGCRQGQWKGKNYQRRWQKRYTLFYNVFSDMILYISAYYKSFSYQKLSQRQYVLLLWWSGTVATVLRSLKSVVRKYVSPRIIFCLYHPDLSSLDQCTFIILDVLSVQPGCCHEKMIHGFPDKYWTVVSNLAP